MKEEIRDKQLRSKLYLDEKTENKDKKNAANEYYYPAFVIDEGGKPIFALFTAHNIKSAVERGAKNPEDNPGFPVEPPADPVLPWYKRIFSFLK